MNAEFTYSQGGQVEVRGSDDRFMAWEAARLSTTSASRPQIDAGIDDGGLQQLHWEGSTVPRD